MAYSGKCMELKITVLSERSQSQKDNYHIFFVLYKIYVGLEYMCIYLSVCLQVCHTMHVCVWQESRKSNEILVTWEQKQEGLEIGKNQQVRNKKDRWEELERTNKSKNNDTYMWKCHKETPKLDWKVKKNIFFKKNSDKSLHSWQRAKTKRCKNTMCWLRTKTQQCGVLLIENQGGPPLGRPFGSIYYTPHIHPATPMNNGLSSSHMYVALWNVYIRILCISIRQKP